MKLDKHMCVRKSMTSRESYLSGEVFEDGGKVDGGTAADALGVLACFEETSDAANGELEAGLAAAGGGFLRCGGAQRLSSSGHRRERERGGLNSKGGGRERGNDTKFVFSSAGFI